MEELTILLEAAREEWNKAIAEGRHSPVQERVFDCLDFIMQAQEKIKDLLNGAVK